MNNELLSQIEKVRVALQNDPDIKEYNALAKQVNLSTYLKETETLLKSMQKELVSLTNENKQEEYNLLKDKYLLLKKEYEEHPLYSNYLQAKEKVNDLLIQISEILSSL